jgi:hypothetical protein
MHFYDGLVLDHNHSLGDDVRGSLIKKLVNFNDIIQNTYNHITESKRTRVLTVNDFKQCSSDLKSIRYAICDIYNEVLNKDDNIYDDAVGKIQKVNIDMSNMIKKWGTKNFNDFMYVCFGKEYKNTIIKKASGGISSVLEKQFHPMRYTMFSLDGSDDGIVSSKDLTMDYNIQEIRKMNTFECFNVSPTSMIGSLHAHVNGVVVFIRNDKMNAGMFVFGIVDHLDIELSNSMYINSKYKDATDSLPSDIDKSLFTNFLMSLTTKEWLVHNSATRLYSYYKGGYTEHKLFKQQSITSMSADFMSRSLYVKRSLLLYFFLDETDMHSKYAAYFLYDLLTLENSNSQDSTDQTELINSFTSKMHELFNNSLVETLQYTTRLNKVDSSKINIEQQICLMKTDDNVKEKAMVKLREVKSKPDDGGSKAKQYLDGLLKIPFGVYRKEPVMDVSYKIKENFEYAYFKNDVLLNIIKDTNIQKDEYKDVVVPICKYSVSDIRHILSKFYKKYTTYDETTVHDIINNKLRGYDKKSIVNYVEFVSKELISLKERHTFDYDVISSFTNINTKTTKANIIGCISEYAHNLSVDDNIKNKIIGSLYSRLSSEYVNTQDNLYEVNKTFNTITDYISNVHSVLDKAAYGHKNAKDQLVRVIGQWINGEHSGYCFGFEGPAGVGKTSLCKYGLANCLVDGDNNPRPFAMIAMGGDSNGSTLHGHNYTYVGSTWGSIVGILMDKKYMNPVIFIDELDKISKTEHGRELVGILIHMLDPTQNDKFQDKYFSGIDIDLSKVLFVLSYNDVDAIDRILLDRIHRVKFSSLSLDEKIHISKEYTLPEIYKKTGLEGAVNMDEEVIKYIIENYTCEPGVRKLREKLFEIVSDINIRMLNRETIDEYPLNITVEDVKNIYFKDVRPVQITPVPSESRVGYANGLWANAHGQGGTLPIEAHFYPTGEFLRLKLTGKQGDVMQESMNVALTLAYKLCTKEQIDIVLEKYNSVNKYGIHIHTPEGATPKDGPSAGSCITTVLYSLLSNQKIKSNCGMTGEIQLTGSITAIGGLDAKILGSLKSGITTYFYPVENEYDFNKFYDKYKDRDEIKGVTFNAVSNINQLLAQIIEKDNE